MNNNNCRGVFCSNKAFTLIELLVVVLIIGILAAVALPQYQKAVARSEGMKNLTILKTLSLAYQHYVVTNGTYPTRPLQLDVSLPSWTGNARFTTYNTPATKGVSDGKWSFQLYDFGNQHGVIMGALNGSYAGCGFYIPHNNPKNKIFCLEVKTSGVIFQGNNGDCCIKLFNATPSSTSGNSVKLGWNYAIPFNWFVMP